MKKLLLMALLLVPTAIWAGDDDADFQVFVACGEEYIVSADLTDDEVLDLMDHIEENCDTDDHDTSSEE